MSIILLWCDSTGSNNVGAAIQSGHMAFPSVTSHRANILWFGSLVDLVAFHITKLGVIVLK